LLDFFAYSARRYRGGGKDSRRQPFGLFQQGRQQVCAIDSLMVASQRQRLRALERFLALFG
jgi:hypothetical protein